ncbi:MAG: nucleotidyltransferase substrate binding protein [Bacteroidales bacterium]|nr:nucleotidyltransferase substrate binding protein [Bacteroidales bacterium]MCF8402583.1 nucleotidyltransferase substrate binding protein [Bacteroidales bacterium]
MENEKNTRWRQRFINFEKAYMQFKEAIENYSTLSVLEKEGLVQRFEYTFELAWKLMKDFMESKGTTLKFPRDIIKNAFHYDMIDTGEIWMDMLDKRNTLAHTYDEKNFEEALKKIHDEYSIELIKFYAYFKNQL